ncbi:MAG TPA: FecR domain-containing protein, partial [Bacteroidales bacterium]|nr:FecR domain-containing protein [Bacteroidales bacterium]
MISETEVYSIINYLAGDITAEEKLRIEAKLAENPDFVAVFEQFKEKWEQTVMVSEIGQIDVKKEWTAFQNLRDIRQTQAHSTRIRRIPVLRYAVAASVLFVVALSSIWFLKLISGENTPKVEQVAFYTSPDKGEEKNVEVIEVHKKEVLVSIPKGQRRQLTLPDGTKVWLNSRSKLTYASDFNQETRDVVLEGEAYFNVAHDKSKPFHVKAKGVVIEVLGTIFNVSAYPEDEAVQTALISGRISMVDSVSDKMIYLQPKEAVRVDFKSGSTTKNGF